MHMIHFISSRGLSETTFLTFEVVLWTAYTYPPLTPLGGNILGNREANKMLPQRMKKVMTDNPKTLANLIDLVNLPSTLREFMGQSQTSRLGCFKRVWSYIKENNLQDPNNKNLVNCDEKLKSILLGKTRVELTELPTLIKLHFPKQPR
ncbi:protein TRI1 isoform X2 [Capsicum annuum]|uniref:protein TRI1 isoform X2 n=1 Tax=Capsicum annuum TaxID=4072 RepID=UPI001FB13A6A|nr:protein TRI1 isoform X2 [Capsicum annuum]